MQKVEEKTRRGNRFFGAQLPDKGVDLGCVFLPVRLVTPRSKYMAQPPQKKGRLIQGLYKTL